MNPTEFLDWRDTAQDAIREPSGFWCGGRFIPDFELEDDDDD